MEFNQNIPVFVESVPDKVFSIKGYDSATNLVSVQSLDLVELRSVPANEIVPFDPGVVSTAFAVSLELRKHQDSIEMDNEVRIVNEYGSDEIHEAQRITAVIIEFQGGKINLETALTDAKMAFSTFKKRRKLYNQDPRWQSQLPRKSGRRAGEGRISSEIEIIIIEAFDSHYKNYGANYQLVYDEVATQCRDKGLKSPAQATMWRRLNEISEKLKIKGKLGPDTANKRLSAFPAIDHISPMKWLHVDHTPTDIVLVDEDTGKPLGRAWLTVVSNPFFNAVMGFSLSYNPPNRASVAAAIYHAMMPKAQFMAELGLSNFSWPMYGTGESYVVDAGSDLNSKDIRRALEIFDIGHKRRMRPQSGGAVENDLGVINRFCLQTLDGSTGSAPHKSPDFDPEAAAKYSIKELTKIITIDICKNHNTGGDGGLTPNMRWDKVYGFLDGVLKLPPIINDPLGLMIEMLPSGRVKVRPAGIVTRGIPYEHGDYLNKIGSMVNIKIDINNLHRIWVQHDGKWKPCRTLKPSSTPRTLIEYKINKKKGPQRGELTPEGMDLHDELNKATGRDKAADRSISRARASAAQAAWIGPFKDVDANSADTEAQGHAAATPKNPTPEQGGVNPSSRRVVLAFTGDDDL
ncbi:Mu transposase C-terminal domain-containing protein [Pseudomonas tremae]|uniref:Mu transposase C-terminal domain-containing protein n=1 Tax=Pseudomonas tremae TaxID=200454 RepID=UPI001F1FBB0E|nr:Mu transposase C-terminal domain-containing protein [Pseudomonas tremae]MCF5803936.1 hypothetical protein [Pseudomonas tremae]MCF5810236.1 hypothetical protein [Pseudomonas tremae]